MGLPFHERDTAKENADASFEYLGCEINDIECMRSKTSDEILDAQNSAPKLDLENLLQNFLPWTPLVDPKGELPQQPFNALMKGMFSFNCTTS